MLIFVFLYRIKNYVIYRWTDELNWRIYILQKKAEYSNYETKLVISNPEFYLLVNYTILTEIVSRFLKLSVVPVWFSMIMFSFNLLSTCTIY